MFLMSALMRETELVDVVSFGVEFHVPLEASSPSHAEPSSHAGGDT